MSGERIDFTSERRRHEVFVGREALLTADDPDRGVVVTGGPGMGKSALLSAWLAQRERAGAAVPHHFIRRGQYDWDDPAKLVSSLIEQLEELCPGVREPEKDAVRLHPAARLVAVLSQVMAPEQARSPAPLVVMIDGLDEYDPPPGAAPLDPLSAFLPHALPPGVRFLCATRPRQPYLDCLAARDGELVQLDLDEPARGTGNDATVRAFWERARSELGLDARLIDEAVARAGGNLQHAVILRKQVVPRLAHASPHRLSARVACVDQRKPSAHCSHHNEIDGTKSHVTFQHI